MSEPLERDARDFVMARISAAIDRGEDLVGSLKAVRGYLVDPDPESQEDDFDQPLADAGELLRALAVPLEAAFEAVGQVRLGDLDGGEPDGTDEDDEDEDGDDEAS